MNKCTTSAKNPIPNDSLSIIILSAGAGRRMKSKGAKALLPIGRTTLLEHQLITLWKMYPKAEIVVVTGFQAQKIRSLCRGVYPVRLVYNPQYETSNVMFSISLALENTVAKNIIVLHGDVLFNTNLISNIVDSKSRVVVLPTNIKINPESVGVIVNDNQITNMSYGLEHGWAQIAYFTGKELNMFEKLAFNREVSSNWFFYEGINHIINNGGTFMAHSPANSRWIEINHTNMQQGIML